MSNWLTNFFNEGTTFPLFVCSFVWSFVCYYLVTSTKGLSSRLTSVFETTRQVFALTAWWMMPFDSTYSRAVAACIVNLHSSSIVRGSPDSKRFPYSANSTTYRKGKKLQCNMHTSLYRPFFHLLNFEYSRIEYDLYKVCAACCWDTVWTQA